MFLMAGDNNTYDVPVVSIYRFTRNGPASDDSDWNGAGVYDSTGPPMSYFVHG